VHRTIASRDTSRTSLRSTEEKEIDFHDRAVSLDHSLRCALASATAVAVHCDRTVGQIAKNNHALRERSDTLGDRRLLWPPSSLHDLRGIPNQYTRQLIRLCAAREPDLIRRSRSRSRTLVSLLVCHTDFSLFLSFCLEHDGIKLIHRIINPLPAPIAVRFESVNMNGRHCLHDSYLPIKAK